MHFKKPFTNHQPVGSDIYVLTLLLVRTEDSIILLINWGKISQHWVLSMDGYYIHLSSCAIINSAPFRTTWWWVVAHFENCRGHFDEINLNFHWLRGKTDALVGWFHTISEQCKIVHIKAWGKWQWQLFCRRHYKAKVYSQMSKWNKGNIGSGNGFALNRLKSHCLNSGAYRRHQTVIC